MERLMVEAVLPTEMPTVRDALARIGLDDRADATAIVMSSDGGIVKHHTLARIGDADPAGYEALYVAGGLFAKGTTTRNGDNLKRIVWMPFDADLFEHQGVSAEERDDFRDQPQGELDLMVASQRAELEARFAALDLPIHRLDYTGYGIAAYIYIDERDQTRVADIKAWHRSIVEAINRAAGIDLVDPKCVDTGTRVTRIPGSFNNKASTPREVRTLAYRPGQSIRVGAPVDAPTMTPVEIPVSGTGLSVSALTAIETALAPFWTDGQRHAMGVAYAGLLASKRVPEQQADASMRRMATNDKRPSDRVRAVTTTYQRVRSGATVQGYSALKTLVPATVLATVSGILDSYTKSRDNQKAAGTTTRLSAAAGASRTHVGGQTESLADDEWARQFPLVPDICYYGSFARYRDIMAPTTEAPDVYHLASALVWFGALVGRQVGGRYASRPLYPNLYGLLIGASGRTRKNTAAERAIELPYDPPANASFYPQLAYSINRDVSSAEGLIKTLAEVPRQILYLDEFSIIQKNAQRKGTRTIFDKLIQAYDNPPFMANLSKNDPSRANEPSVSILACTQPRRLAEQMTSEDLHSGFANRLMYFIGYAKERMPRPPDIDQTAAWKLYCDWTGTIRDYVASQSKVYLRMDSAATDRWDAWYMALEGTKDRSEDENDMVVRLPVHVQKVALIFALSDGADWIQDRHLEPAIALIDWMWLVVRELMKGWGIGIDQQIELTIERTLNRIGPVSRRELQQRTKNRRWSGRDFAAVFRAMAENGTLSIDDDGNVSFPAYQS
jgi:hypothetical protein